MKMNMVKKLTCKHASKIFHLFKVNDKEIWLCPDCDKELNDYIDRKEWANRMINEFLENFNNER